MTETVITVSNLGKSYPVAHPRHGGARRGLSFFERFRTDAPQEEDTHWALKNVSFSVNRSERIGIIGRNGAGKSTLLKIMSRVTYPTTGEIRIRGNLTSLLEVGTGFNDNLSGRENVFLNSSLYGMSREQTLQRFDEIVEFSGVRRFIDTPLKHYSSGMRMRLAFSVAAHLDPDILLLDEVLAVGDMSFQRKCLERVDELTSGGQTLFFVSHSMDQVMRYCDRCIWIEDGHVSMDGDAETVCSAYVEAVLGGKSKYEAYEAKSEMVLPIEGAEPDSVEDSLVPTQPLAPKLAPSRGAVSLEPNGSDTPAANGEFSEQPQASLVSAAVINAAGEGKIMHRVSDTVGVEFVYRVARPGMYTPGIQIYCPQGTLAFISVPPVRDPQEYHHPREGLYTARAWIPPHLLNIGTYSVTISLFSADRNPFLRHFKKERLLSFQTVEPVGDELSAKGCLPRPFPGALRPKLDWQMNNN